MSGCTHDAMGALHLHERCPECGADRMRVLSDRQVARLRSEPLVDVDDDAGSECEHRLTTFRDWGDGEWRETCRSCGCEVAR